MRKIRKSARRMLDGLKHDPVPDFAAKLLAHATADYRQNGPHGLFAIAWLQPGDERVFLQFDRPSSSASYAACMAEISRLVRDVKPRRIACYRIVWIEEAAGVPLRSQAGILAMAADLEGGSVACRFAKVEGRTAADVKIGGGPGIEGYATHYRLFCEAVELAPLSQISKVAQRAVNGGPKWLLPGEEPDIGPPLLH